MLSVSPSSSPNSSLRELDSSNPSNESLSPNLENSVVNYEFWIPLVIALAVTASPLLAIPFILPIAAALALNPAVVFAILVGISFLLFVIFSAFLAVSYEPQGSWKVNDQMPNPEDLPNKI